MPDHLPEPRYPRTPGHIPDEEEDPLGGWYVKTSIKGAPDGPLGGRRVVLKDNICLAGVPMMIGSSIVEGYVADVDATVVTRILDAGGEIAGKAKCELLSRAGGSHTASSGPVRNPHAPEHTTGGSSSGCAAIVGSGEVTMAIGGDQAGSIRFPSSFCGIYGMKPTWGLVPYTGAAPLEPTLDHLGPMTSTVEENALLLEVIAGPDDGLDPRQYAPQPGRYTEELGQGVQDLRIGVLSEGFGLDLSEPEVDESVRAAASQLSSLGASVSEISIPAHRLGLHALLPIFLQGNRAVFNADSLPPGHRGLYVTSFVRAFAGWKSRTNELSDGLKLELLMAEHIERTHGPRHYAKAQNLSRRLSAAYDAALTEHDLLLMPTVPHRAPRRPGRDSPLEDRLAPTLAATSNTAPFNVTGHPAMSIPCGKHDELPIGFQLVARRWNESTIYRAAHAFEQNCD
jgi:amidase